MAAMSAASWRAAASAVSMSTASKAMRAPGVRRPRAGMSAEMTVAILG